MQTKWVLVESWHLLDPDWKTYCGLLIEDFVETVEILPYGEKTCENCLRVDELREEKAARLDNPVQ